jgi:hypothetical protein
MPLEGLRAWIGEVERKLGMRTRVFLVLTVIALGGAGAAIYLAIDARESSVSESDVQALQERLEARMGEAGAAATPAPEEPVEPVEPAPQTEPEPEPRSRQGDKSGATGGGSTGGASVEGASPESGGASAPSGANSAKLKDLLERAKEQSEQTEETPGGN